MSWGCPGPDAGRGCGRHVPVDRQRRRPIASLAAGVQSERDGDRMAADRQRTERPLENRGHALDRTGGLVARVGGARMNREPVWITGVGAMTSLGTSYDAI